MLNICLNLPFKISKVCLNVLLIKLLIFCLVKERFLGLTTPTIWANLPCYSVYPSKSNGDLHVIVYAVHSEAVWLRKKHWESKILNL